MRENTLDHRRLFDSRDDLQLAAALLTAFKIKVKNTLEQPSPSHTHPRAMRMRAIARVPGCRVRGRSRHNRSAQFGVGRERPMKAYQMQARARHQGGEPLHLPAGRQVNSNGVITIWLVPSR